MFTVEYRVGAIRQEYLFGVRTDHRGSDDVVVYLCHVHNFIDDKIVGQWSRHGHTKRDFQVDAIPEEVQAEAMQRVMDSVVVELPPWS